MTTTETSEAMSISDLTADQLYSVCHAASLGDTRAGQAVADAMPELSRDDWLLLVADMHNYTDKPAGVQTKLMDAVDVIHGLQFRAEGSESESYWLDHHAGEERLFELRASFYVEGDHIAGPKGIAAAIAVCRFWLSFDPTSIDDACEAVRVGMGGLLDSDDQSIDARLAIAGACVEETW